MEGVVLFGRGLSDVKFALSFLNRRYGANWTQDGVREAEREEREIELGRRLRAEAEAYAKPQQEHRLPYKIDPDKLFTISEVADLVGVGTPLINSWSRKGWLKKKNLGRSRRILGADLVAFIDQKHERVEAEKKEEKELFERIARQSQKPQRPKTRSV